MANATSESGESASAGLRRSRSLDVALAASRPKSRPGPPITRSHDGRTLFRGPVEVPRSRCPGESSGRVDGVVDLSGCPVRGCPTARPSEGPGRRSVQFDSKDKPAAGRELRQRAPPRASGTPSAQQREFTSPLSRADVELDRPLAFVEIPPRTGSAPSRGKRPTAHSRGRRRILRSEADDIRSQLCEGYRQAVPRRMPSPR